MSLTPTQLSELQTIVETLRTEFPNSDDELWQAAIRIQKGGLGPVTGTGGQPAFDAAVADIVEEAEQVSTVQGRQGGLGESFDVAVFNTVPIEGELPAGSVGDVIYIDTAPNTYLATDVITLTPAGPNSVILSEIGTQVARTVSAANGGLEVNNLNTGAGFERVLTTSDMGAGLTVEDEGVPLAGAASTLNFVGAGVTASGAGATKTITIPGGGTPGGADTQVQFNNAGAFDGDANFTWDSDNAQLTITNTISSSALLALNAGNNPSTIIDVNSTLSTGYLFARLRDQTGSNYFDIRHNYGLSTPNHEFRIESSQGGTLIELENEGNCWFGGGENGPFGVVNTTATTQVRVNDTATLLIEERSAAAADQGGYGQLWVRDDTPNVLMFTDDAGTDFEISAGVLPVSSAEGEILVGNGSGGWREGFGILFQADAAPPGVDEGYLTIQSTGTADVRRPQIFLESQNTTSTAIFFEISFDDGFYIQAQGGAADALVFGREVNSVDTEMLSFGDDASIRIEAGANFFLEERAAAATDIAGYGQLWVRNDTPNNLIFTDDAGTDFLLNSGGVATGDAQFQAVWFFDDTVSAIPEANSFVFNTADPTTATYVRVADEDINSVDRQSWMSALKRAERVRIIESDDPNEWNEWVVRNPTNQSGYWEIPFNWIAGTGTLPANDQECLVQFIYDTYVEDADGNNLYLAYYRGTDSGAPLNGLLAHSGVRVSSPPGNATELQLWDEEGEVFEISVNNGITTITAQDPAGSNEQLVFACDEVYFRATTPVGDTMSIFSATQQVFLGDNAPSQGASLYIRELAAAKGDSAGFGQFWVLNSSPNVPYFTRDDGVDIDLHRDLYFNSTLQAQATILGLDVRDTLRVGTLGSTTGCLKLGEQPNADVDEAGYGQIWVVTDTPNRLKFTDDSGQDYDVGMVGGYVNDNVFLNSSRNYNTAGNFAANNILYFADGSNNTVTLENSSSVVNWPVYTSIQVLAPGSGVQTIAEGTGVTLFDDTGTDLVGGCTVSGGVTTIFRASTTDYIIFGSGITP